MKRIMTVILCALLLLTSAAALADGDSAYADTPSAEVLSHLAEKFPGHTLEDYIVIKNTPNGDYGFALIVSGKNRTLLAYHAENGVMRYWRKNAGAVPQGEGTACFQRHRPNGVINPDRDNVTYGNDLGFSVFYFAPGYDEFASHTVSFHWQDGAFKLDGYTDLKAFEGSVYVTDSGVTFSNSKSTKNTGRVKGTVQRDIRYASFSALPKTLADAEKKLTVAPAIPAGELKAQNIHFTGGQKYAVYSAPSDGPGVLRGGNGKAAVSTNDWIQVFGEDDGWILIQYAIDNEHMRFGYIPAETLPKSATVAPFAWNPKIAYLTQDASLTDDPLYSQSQLAQLPEGQSVLVLARMGEWAYVESSAGDWVRGFIKQSLLRYDMIYYLADHSENIATGTLAVTPDGRLVLRMGVRVEAQASAFLLKDELQGIEIGLTETTPDGDYLLEAALPKDTTSISFIPVGAEEPLFRVEW